MKKILDILQGIRPESDFAGSDNFIDDGLIDSFDIVSLVTEIEDEYGIFIDALDIVPENFVSVDAIVSLIKKSEGEA